MGNGPHQIYNIYIYIYTYIYNIYIYIWIEGKMTMHHEIIGYPIRQIHKLAMNTLGGKVLRDRRQKAQCLFENRVPLNPILFTGWSSCHIISIIFHHLPIQITITCQAKKWSGSNWRYVLCHETRTPKKREKCLKWYQFVCLWDDWCLKMGYKV